MLIICNGAIKSGSTWLYNILVHLVECEHPPARYLTGRSVKSPCIKPDCLAEFLAEEDIAGRNYISKNHLASPAHRDLLAAEASAYVFDIERDPRDVVVSNYYHDCFRNGYEGDFDSYYWSRGRYVAAELAAYHELWRTGSPRFYVSSYEALHRDFPAEARRIAAVFNIDLSDAAVDQLKADTSITKLRKAYKDDQRYQGSKFFRKGEIGDWKNHFEADTLADVIRLQERGLSLLDRRNLLRKIGRRLGRVS